MAKTIAGFLNYEKMFYYLMTILWVSAPALTI